MAITDPVELERNQSFLEWFERQRRTIDPVPTVSELAERGGFQQSYISKLRENDTTVTALMVNRICNALGVSAYEGFVAARYIEDGEHKHGASLRQIDRILDGLTDEERDEIVSVVELLAYSRKKKHTKTKAVARLAGSGKT